MHDNTQDAEEENPIDRAHRKMRVGRLPGQYPVVDEMRRGGAKKFDDARDSELSVALGLGMEAAERLEHVAASLEDRLDDVLARTAPPDDGSAKLSTVSQKASRFNTVAANRANSVAERVDICRDRLMSILERLEV